MRRIFILNGPNLNRLGAREPGIYGAATLADIEHLCEAEAARLGLAVTFRQSNHEGALIDWIHEAGNCAPPAQAGILLNPAGFGHNSVALLDALLSVSVPVVEVHLSNIYQREPFRHQTLTARAARGVISGLGAQGYALGLQALHALLGA